jgi:hypothetical protein
VIEWVLVLAAADFLLSDFVLPLVTQRQKTRKTTEEEKEMEETKATIFVMSPDGF